MRANLAAETQVLPIAEAKQARADLKSPDLSPDERAEAESELAADYASELPKLGFVALFGIANTLALSVFERTREFGLLRAVAPQLIGTGDEGVFEHVDGGGARQHLALGETARGVAHGAEPDRGDRPREGLRDGARRRHVAHELVDRRHVGRQAQPGDERERSDLGPAGDLHRRGAARAARLPRLRALADRPGR